MLPSHFYSFWNTFYDIKVGKQQAEFRPLSYMEEYRHAVRLFLLRKLETKTCKEMWDKYCLYCIMMLQHRVGSWVWKTWISTAVVDFFLILCPSHSLLLTFLTAYVLVCYVIYLNTCRTVTLAREFERRHNTVARGSLMQLLWMLLDEDRLWS